MKGELVSLAKPIVFATAGQKKIMLANFFINKNCCNLIPRGLELLTSLTLLGFYGSKNVFLLIWKTLSKLMWLLKFSELFEFIIYKMLIFIVRQEQPSKGVLQNSCCALVVKNFEIRM